MLVVPEGVVDRLLLLPRPRPLLRVHGVHAAPSTHQCLKMACFASSGSVFT